MNGRSAELKGVCDVDAVDDDRRGDLDCGDSKRGGAEDRDRQPRVAAKDANNNRQGDEKEDTAAHLACQYSACRLAHMRPDMRACTLCKNAWFCDARCETLAVSEHKKRCDLSIKTLGSDPTTFKARLILERVAVGLTHIDTKIDWHKIYDIQQRFKIIARVTYRTVTGDSDISLDTASLVAALNRAWVRLHYTLTTLKAAMDTDRSCPPEDARILIQFVQLQRLPTLFPPPSSSALPSSVVGASERPQVQLLIVRSVAPTSDPTAFVEDSFRSEATIPL